jgi:hypothetical protein
LVAELAHGHAVGVDVPAFALGFGDFTYVRGGCVLRVEQFGAALPGFGPVRHPPFTDAVAVVAFPDDPAAGVELVGGCCPAVFYVCHAPDLRERPQSERIVCLLVSLQVRVHPVSTCTLPGL